MDAYNSSEELSDLRVSKDAIVESVAESILSSEKPVGVVDKNNEIVGVLYSSHVINVLFGGRSEEDNQD
jgi:glycine betaine/proline transport system ATP-binding protein